MEQEFYTSNKNYYERNAKNYENSSWYFFNKYKDTLVSKEILKCIKEIGKKHIKVLEIGPGTGYLLSKIVQIGNVAFEYSCVEHSIEMGRILNERYGKIVSMHIYSSSVTFDFIENKFRDSKFDLIIGSSILHHLPDYRLVVSSLSGLLDDGGIMYFVREPIYNNECNDSTKFRNILCAFYEGINKLFLKTFIKNLFWSQKIKQESAKEIAIFMFKEGVSVQPFYDLTKSGFNLLFHRKYNRRVSSFFSFLENKWLSDFRKDIYGNTLFSIAVIKPVK